MKKTEKIINRYVELSLAVTAAEQAGDLVAQEAAMDKFWAFVDRYIYGIDIAVVREADDANRLKMTAFC